MEGGPDSGTLRVSHQRDSNGRTALHLAARNGQEHVANILMETLTKSCHEAKDNDGRTALHLAAQTENFSSTLSLVNVWKGGIFKEDNKCHTPLKLLSKKGHSEVVRTLLESAAELDHIGNVLREAAEWRFEEACALWARRMEV